MEGSLAILKQKKARNREKTLFVCSGKSVSLQVLKVLFTALAKRRFRWSYSEHETDGDTDGVYVHRETIRRPHKSFSKLLKGEGK